MKQLVLVLLVSSFFGCDTSSVYEKSKDIANRTWIADSVVNFNVQLNQPENTYDFNLAVRNTADYPFHNLYVTYFIKDSLGNVLKTDLVNNNLFDPKSGKPYGSSLGGIYTNKFPLLKDFLLAEGSYQVQIEQNMRLDSLEGIVSIGVGIDLSEK